MAFTVPNIAAVTYPALAKFTQTDNDILAALDAGTAVVLYGCAVTAQVSPDGTVAVATGHVATGGLPIAVAAGNVGIVSGSGSTAAHATLDRIDLVWADGTTGAKGVTAGTPGTRGTTSVAGTVLPPALPAGKVALGFVYVPATATTIASTAANIVDKRPIAPNAANPSVITMGVRTITDAVLTANSNTMTSATAAFTDADVDRNLSLAVGFLPPGARIASINSTTSVEMNTPASANGSAKTVMIGGVSPATHQEGGSWLLGGTFIPFSSVASVDIKVAGTTSGLHGTGVFFMKGDASARSETPLAPVKNSVTRALNIFVPLTGVTEWSMSTVGILHPGAPEQPIQQRLVFTGLTPGRTYSWELVCGGQSYSKAVVFETGAQPKYLAVDPDQMHTWVACVGNSRIALIQHGHSNVYGYVNQGSPPDMTIIAEVQLATVPGKVSVQPVTGRYVATVSAGLSNLILLDTTTMTVTLYPIPGSPPDASYSAVLWSPDGAYLWVTSYNATNALGRVHRFVLGTLSFDTPTTVRSDDDDFLSPIGMAQDGSYMLVSAFYQKKIYKVLTATPFTVSVVVAALTNSVSAGKVLADGTFLLIDQVADTIIHYSAAGSVLWTSAVVTAGAGNASMVFDSDQQRAFWTAGGVLGWTWIGTGKHINAGAAFADSDYGDLGVTSDETTLIALPTSNKIYSWPGNALYIRDVANASGLEFCELQFNGAIATGGG